MTRQTDIAAIKNSLLAGLPLTTEQMALRDSLLPLAGKVATNLLNRWKRHRWLDADDLRQQAAVELEAAIREYDTARSPDLAAFVGRRVRQRLQSRLQEQRREHSRYRPLVQRPSRSCRPKRCYRDEPIDKIIAEEIAVAVRRAFASRDVAIYIDKLTGRSAEEIVRKYSLTPQRISQICRQVRGYIHSQLKDSAVPVNLIVAALINYEIETRKRAMQLLGYTDAEILEKIEKSIF